MILEPESDQRRGPVRERGRLGEARPLGRCMECTAVDPARNRSAPLAEQPVNALPELPTRVGATAPAASIPHRRRFRRTLTTFAVFDRRQPLWPPPSSTGATSGPHIGRRGWSAVRWFRVGKARSAGVAIRASHRGAALLVQELLRKGRNNRPGLSVRGCGSSRTSAFDTRGRS
jgi:hypothetical protein